MAGVIVHTEDGSPVFFADVPNSGVVKTNTKQQSGNTSFDARSGKFAAKGPAKKPAAPANTDPNEFARMYAAVRDAARQLTSYDESAVKEFLSKRAANADQVDIQAFASMVKQQRINDLVDLFNSKLQTRAEAVTGEPQVTLNAPDNWVKASLGGLEPSEVEQLINVLVSLGNEEDDVRKLLAPDEAEETPPA